MNWRKLSIHFCLNWKFPYIHWDDLLSSNSSSTYNNITINEDNVNGETTKITSTKTTSIFNDCDKLFELLLMNTPKIGYKMWMTTKILTHKQKLPKKRCASSSARIQCCCCEFVFLSQRCERLLGVRASAADSSSIIIFAQKWVYFQKVKATFRINDKKWATSKH